MKTRRLKTLDLTKRKRARERFEQRDANREDLRSLGNGRCLETFRREVTGGSGARGYRKDVGHAAEIDEFERYRVEVQNNEDVFRFEVAMHQVEAEEVLRGVEE